MALYTCTKCGKKVPWEYEVCPYCKTPRPSRRDEPLDINKMKQCKACGKLIAKSANVCPKCGERQGKKHTILGVFAVLLGIVIVVSAVGSMFGKDKDDGPTKNVSSGNDQSQSQQSPPKSEPTDKGMAYEVTYKNARIYKDSIGTTWVQAITEITNTGDKNLYLSSGSYDLENTDGSLLASKSMVSTYPSVLAPGEKGYMYDETTLENYEGDGNLKFLPRPSVKESKVDLVRYNISDLEVSKSQYYGVNVKGRIENQTDEIADGMVYIVAFFYDNNGTPIGSAFTILTEDLEPGTKIGFDFNGFSLPDDVEVDSIAETIVYAYPLQYQF